MQDFKNFIIRVQTFVIFPDNVGEINSSNSLFELKESALTDVLNQPEEQIYFQIQRLELIRQIFIDFWKNHDTIPDYTRKEKATYFACLELESYFNINNEKKYSCFFNHPTKTRSSFSYSLLKPSIISCLVMIVLFLNMLWSEA